MNCTTTHRESEAPFRPKVPSQADIDAMLSCLDDLDETVIEARAPAPAVEVAESQATSVTADRLMPDIAPAFRGYAKLPAPNTGCAYTEADTENLITQRIADLEWLHRRGHRVEIDSHDAAGGRARHLLTADRFDRDLAREVAACRLLSGDAFVVALCLPDWLEVEMAQLCRKSVKMKRLRVSRDRPKANGKLLKSITEPEHSKHVAKWLDVWHCMELVGDSPKAVARLYTAMTGQKMSEDNARKRCCPEVKKRVKKRVAS